MCDLRSMDDSAWCATAVTVADSCREKQQSGECSAGKAAAKQVISTYRPLPASLLCQHKLISMIHKQGVGYREHPELQVLTSFKHVATRVRPVLL